MKILLHMCCGPCSVVPLEELLSEGHDVMGHFFNPNIHPFKEWELRRETLENFALPKIKLLPVEKYDPSEWFRGVSFRESERCRVCYHQRLFKTAMMAKKGKFDGFTTTLFYSRRQRHDLLLEIANAVASEVGIPLLYRDWRPGWASGIEKSKELGMYRQGYCGCIYSEIERYARKTEV